VRPRGVRAAVRARAAPLPDGAAGRAERRRGDARDGPAAADGGPGGGRRPRRRPPLAPRPRPGRPLPPPPPPARLRAAAPLRRRPARLPGLFGE